MGLSGNPFLSHYNFVKLKNFRNYSKVQTSSDITIYQNYVRFPQEYD